MTILATIGNAFCILLGEFKNILLMFLHFSEGLFSLVDHLIDGNVIEVLLLAENKLFVVFEVVHQFQTLILIHKILDTFNHTPAEIIS